MKNESEKKRKYSSRVINTLNTERATFVLLVFTTAATTAPEFNKFHKRLAELISNKRKENYSNVISYIRTRLSFAMLKSLLVSIHGVRGKNEKVQTDVSNVAFGLIPSEEVYECR